jgi:predicted DNA helicase
MDKHNPGGIVYELSHKTITIALSKQLSLANNRPLRIDLSVNDTTYKRMEEALLKARSPEFSKLQMILSGKYHLNTCESHHFDNTLNDAQNQSIDLAFNNNGYYSIQGPPGTGKTFTAAHLIKEIVQQGKKVLITADSNAAVDHLIRNCLKLGLDPLRIGNPIRVNKDLKPYTLDYRIYGHVLYNQVTDLQKMIEDTKEVQGELKRPDSKDMRGYSYGELIKMLESNQSGRGLSKAQLKDMKPFLKLQKKMDSMYATIQKLRDEITFDLIQKHSVIASTNSTSGCELLEETDFDWVVIDEAAQASMPSAMIPIIKANRFVLIGDHYQLPPVVLNQEAKELGLDKSLMDYLAEQYPYFLSRLSVQYRMHKKINNLVSHMFYDNSLIPHKSVANRRVLKDDIIDVINVSGKELVQKDSKSFYNQSEIDRVEEILLDLDKKGIKKEQIAVISPYKAQVKKLQAMFKEYEIDTVDSFQGREKDVVIISFVRSNEQNVLGFLTDYRRLNVSISRAKSKLILVGNIGVLKSHKMYNYLFNYIKQ